ncbi:MAG TPA: LytTR family DNA-binding domain-containing protein [Saprospiraceae bacterium]|nr:LytTR family DNA-binding domain-containing protein [Saprospiraceae bacterium]HMQ83537.1 LytTR family DNA-binding domain-containing protein [Saprospiraceae bacterium]
MIHCLIVDDEQPARDMLEAYVWRLGPGWVVAKCKSAAEARGVLVKEAIDLMFLDVEMPRMNGLDFLRELEQRPAVVLTTAFAQYALDGYDLEVLDYLLKPIGFERFQKATEKAMLYLDEHKKAMAYDVAQGFEHQSMVVKEGYDYRKIMLKDICYIQAMREYVVLHTAREKTMTLRPLAQLEATLPAAHFIRIHRSYIVARGWVKGSEGDRLLMANNTHLPIGKTYKKRVLQELF